MRSSRLSRDSHLPYGARLLTRAPPACRECQSQARGGQYPCPAGEPSICRYYHNREYRAKAHCVYYYCTTHKDDCCDYYDGTVYGTLEDSVYTTRDGTNITFAQFANETQFANDFPDERNASNVCKSMVDSLAKYVWWKEWFDDELVTTAYLNFQITSMEFSHAYGLFLLSTKGDQLTIQKSSTTECMDPDAPDSCYNAWYKPESSSTAIALNQSMTFSVGDQNVMSQRARRLGTVGSMQLPTSGKKLTEKKPTLVTEGKLKEHNALTRFAGSCDKCACRLVGRSWRCPCPWSACLTCLRTAGLGRHACAGGEGGRPHGSRVRLAHLTLPSVCCGGRNKPACAAMLASDSLLVPKDEDEEGDRAQRHLEALKRYRELRGRELRRGGRISSSVRFAMSSGGNRCGNS